MCIKLLLRVSFFNISPITSHNFHGIHHYIVDLWTSCVYSIFRYWHHAKFATGYRITTMWAPKQNGRKVWLKEQHLAIWHANEDRLHWHQLYLLKCRTRLLLVSVCMTYTNEADFSVGYQMTRYYTLSHAVLPFLALKLISGDRSHISRDANNELLNTCKIPIITQYDDRYSGSDG